MSVRILPGPTARIPGPTTRCRRSSGRLSVPAPWRDASHGTPIAVRPLAALVDPRLLADAAAVVNTTSTELAGAGFPPVARRRRRAAASSTCSTGDTAFLAAARRAGRPTADGTEMLLHQGARAFTLWTGRRAPVAVLRAALGAQR